jgi:hypothetical protein
LQQGVLYSRLRERTLHSSTDSAKRHGVCRIDIGAR